MTPAKILIIVFFATGIFAAGYLTHRQPVRADTSTPTRQVAYYTCPMHRQYKSDRPGDAPCCGMRLVPVYTGTAGTAAADSRLPGAVQVGADQQQLIGVRTDTVRLEAASQRLRVPGRIAADESRLYRLVAAADGWIRELGSNTPGTFVQQGQILASYYTSNLLAASQTLLFAQSTNEQAGQGYMPAQRAPTALSLQVAVDSLRSLGMSDLQIDEMKKTRAAAAQVNIYAPASGFVLARGISPAQRFDKGAELYRIADIGHVWVLIDSFEKDRELIRRGTLASVRYRGREFTARMSDVLPQFDPQSRTLKSRFELDNPGYVLRPDMFVDVEIQVKMPVALAVPADAVIDSGRRKTVYVVRGSGMFEPREVETGWRLGDRVEITRGLEEGDRIAVSSNFLIDSESRMRGAR